MADAKLSALTALAGTDVAPATDLMYVDDISVTTGKKITVADLASAVVRSNTGQVIQQQVTLDAGGITNSASLVNINTANISFTPKSAASHLLVDVQFFGLCEEVDGATTSSAFQVYDVTNSALLGTANSFSVASQGMLGAALAAPCYVRAYVVNTVTSARAFQLRASINNASVHINVSAAIWTITEIKD